MQVGKITLELNHELPISELISPTLKHFRVTRLWLSNLVKHPEQTITQAPQPLIDAFDNYFDGQLSSLDSIDIELIGLSDFQRDVLNWLAQAPKESISYQQIAQAIGNPKATRAVGAALKSNPIPLIVPCHRVLPQPRQRAELHLDLKRHQAWR